MKLTAPAGVLSHALRLAASLAGGDGKAAKVATLEALRIVAEDGAAKVIGNIFDFELSHVLDADVTEPGILAVPGGKLTKLVSGFPGDAKVTISNGADDVMGLVACGRSKYKLPALAPGELPQALDLGDQIGSVILSRDEASRLFTATIVAVGTEETRYYLSGLHVHDKGPDTAVVATDGFRLARFILAGRRGLSPESDRTLIIPTIAAKLAAKLLNSDRSVEKTVQLRRSQNLFAIEGERFRLVSKLIAAHYPAYENVIPEPSGNIAIVQRKTLIDAVGRLTAVADEGNTGIGLTWADTDEPALRLCLSRHPDIAEEAVDARIAGHGRIAVGARFLCEQLSELSGDCVRLDHGDKTITPLRVTDPDDENFVGVVMRQAWLLPSDNT